MSIADAADVPEGSRIVADLCVVGAGPAGIALAVALEGGPHTVVLLESGGLSPEPEVDALSDIENIGLPLNTEGPSGSRLFGGTTNRWYGRLARYPSIDFEARPWAPLSGWPVSPAAVREYERPAAQLLGLANPSPLNGQSWAGDSTVAALAGPGLRSVVYLWPRALALAHRHIGRVRRSETTRMLLHAHATRLVPDGDRRRVTTLGVRGPQGHGFTVEARAFVLAAGGLANPRLLLLSRDAGGVAIGNRHDAVGRYYMNHPRTDGVARLYLDRSHRNYVRWVRVLTVNHHRRFGGKAQWALRLDDDVQRTERLLNCGTFFYVASEPRLRRLGEMLFAQPGRWRSTPRQALTEFAELGANLPLVAVAAVHRWAQRPYRVDHLVAVDQAEQTPDPGSRVTLGERCDRFGDPVPRLHWTVSDDSTRALRRLHALLARHFETLGIGQLKSDLLVDPHFVPDYTDAAHPMGTTRMSLDPRAGVVDSDCRVHELTNLFIAGSSVFPTAGQGPPTLTIVCLALRLADHLRRLLARAG